MRQIWLHFGFETVSTFFMVWGKGMLGELRQLANEVELMGTIC